MTKNPIENPISLISIHFFSPHFSHSIQVSIFSHANFNVRIFIQFLFFFLFYDINIGELIMRIFRGRFTEAHGHRAIKEIVGVKLNFRQFCKPALCRFAKKNSANCGFAHFFWKFQKKIHVKILKNQSIL